MLSWVGAIGDDVRTAVVAALYDVGEHEIPASSNSGKWVDWVNERTGSPKGSYWCANAVALWWTSAQWPLPPVPASCQSWYDWAQTTGRWFLSPALGDCILYGADKLAHHAGIVMCIDPLLTIEGNTTLDGYSRNGELVTLKAPNTVRVLGYVRAKP